MPASRMLADYSARPAGARRATDYLLKLSVISARTAEALHYLRRLRNQAAHQNEFAIEAAQALEYAQLAKRMIEALEERPAEIPGFPTPGY